MSLREYFCPNGIFHLEELRPSHSQERLLRALDIEQEAGFWHKRKHLRVLDGTGCCLLRHCQHWAEGLKTDSVKVVHGAVNCGDPCTFPGCAEPSCISLAECKPCGLKPQAPSYQKHFPKHGNEAA